MEKNKKIEINLKILAIIILGFLLIGREVVSNLSLRKDKSDNREFSLSDSEIMQIANSNIYEIQDEKLKETYNELLGKQDNWFNINHSFL